MERIEHVNNSQMEWSSEYSVGVSEVDSQHKELLIFFNHAIANCSGEPAKEKEYFDETIDVFINFLSKHFGTEELFLFGRNYAQYKEHKLDHIKLLEKIRFVKQEVQNYKWEMKLVILATTLKDWFMRHFNTYDINAKGYFMEEAAGTETDEVSYFASQI